MFKFFDADFLRMMVGKDWVLDYVGFLAKGEWRLSYDSYMVNDADLGVDSIKFSRNIDVRDPLFLPSGLKSELLIQTGDVIHR